MDNVSKIIRQAYYDALNGQISVEVYKEDVAITEALHHVVIRIESETDKSHKAGFVTNPVVITDVIGVFDNSIDPDEVDNIDGEIRAILKTDVNATLVSSGVLISNIRPVSSESFAEDDGSKRYYRKITRWTQRISHT
jgi:hypothetical protein